MKKDMKKTEKLSAKKVNESNKKTKSNVVQIKQKTKRTIVKISEENGTIEVRGREYKINKKVLRETVERIWTNDKHHEHLNNMDEILYFLKTKGLLIEEFLEYISDEYVIKYDMFE